MKDTFVWWLLIESFVLLLDKILENGIFLKMESLEAHLVFSHGCNFLRAVTVAMFFCFCVVCFETWNNGMGF